MTARSNPTASGHNTALDYASRLLSGLAYAWRLDASYTGPFPAGKRTRMAILLGEGLIMVGLAFLVPLRWLHTILHTLRNEMIIPSQLERKLHGYPQTPAHLR